MIGTTGKTGLIFASQETKAQSVNVYLFIYFFRLKDHGFNLLCFPTYSSNVRFFVCMLLRKCSFSITLILDTLKVKQLKSSHSP